MSRHSTLLKSKHDYSSSKNSTIIAIQNIINTNWLILKKFKTEFHKKNNLYFKLDINGKSDFFYSDSHNNKSKSYQLINFTIGRSKGNFTSELWMRNIFNKYYSTRGFFFGNEAPNFIDTLYKRQGDPKNIGLSLRYNF